MLAPILTLLTLALALPPRPANHVTDAAGVIPSDRASALEKKLETFEHETSNHVVVYVAHKVPDGATASEMTSAALREWQPVNSAGGSSIVLLVFVDDRRSEIGVGDGLQRLLTSSRADVITRSIMKPRIEQGDYAGAVEHGVEAILNSVVTESDESGARKSVAAAEVTQPQRDSSPGDFVPLTVVASALAGGAALLLKQA